MLARVAAAWMMVFCFGAQAQEPFAKFVNSLWPDAQAKASRGRRSIPR